MRRRKGHVRRELGRDLRLLLIGLILAVIGGLIAYAGLMHAAHELTH